MSQNVISCKRNLLSESLKAGLFSFIICTFLVLLLALIVKLTQMSSNALPIINQVIKGVSVIAGTIIGIRGSKGLYKGALGAILFVIFTTIIFALLGGKFDWKQIGLDVIMCVLLGGVVGAIRSNKTSKE
ncbi:MAG: TIGR04086 family membrane protein [Clostridia bacterium]